MKLQPHVKLPKAIDCIQNIVEEEQIACGFERLDGYLFMPPGSSPAFLQPELEAAQRAGLNTRLLSKLYNIRY